MARQRDQFEDRLAVVVGRNITRARKERGVTTRRLAEILGCSERSVYAYESGERRLSLADAVRVSYSLGLDLDRLVFGGNQVMKSLPKISITDLKG